MIWFILIYVITLILIGVCIYIDMDKGESLEQYFRGLNSIDFIFLFLFPIFNTIALIGIVFYLLFNHIWDKIKH